MENDVIREGCGHGLAESSKFAKITKEITEYVSSVHVELVSIKAGELAMRGKRKSTGSGTSPAKRPKLSNPTPEKDQRK